MEIEFGPSKDALNVAKHGISLARAADLELLAYVSDGRFVEPSFRLYGLIDGESYCIAGTEGAGIVRVISVCRAQAKKMKLNVG